MRKSGDWMALVDDRVLEYLSENETGSPTKMKKDGPIRYSTGYISERCKELADRGLIQPLGNGVYRITEDGGAYLAGNLDTETMERIEDQESDESESNDPETSKAESNFNSEGAS